LLLFNAFDGQGSLAGNIALFGVGLLLVVLSPTVLIAGLINWRKALASPEDAEIQAQVIGIEYFDAERA
jgi:hypothetical protein